MLKSFSARQKQFAVAIAAAVLAWCAQFAYSAEPSWHTGRALESALQQEAALTLGDAPTRDALERFSRSQHVAVLLDRRIDPDRKIDLRFRGVPLAEGLLRIASRIEAGMAMVGPVAYFGPVETARRIRTVSALRTDELSKLPDAARRRWSRLLPMKWDDLTAPRELLVEQARAAQVAIDGLDSLPHDLWAAADLPPMSLPERLTLVLGQFDLTYEPSADGDRLRIVPMPDRPRIEREYPVANAPQIARQLSASPLLAEADIRADGRKLIVAATQEDHDAVRTLLRGESVRRTAVEEGTKVYTLNVELPLGQALAQIARQVGFELDIDRQGIAAAGRSLDQKVKINVKQASLDDLLHALLEPAGLRFTRNGNQVSVSAKP